VSLISQFDPWRSNLCTCPTKLTFNPYTGCDHGCVYCYASSYISKFHDCRPKTNLLVRLRKEADGLNGELLSVSTSSDPYPTLEAELKLTRQCLKILSNSKCRLQIITKSPLVTRDIDLLKKIPSVVSLTITTDNDSLAKLLEPNAPASSARLKAVATLLENEVPVCVRIDPLIPYVNDEPETLVKTLASLGVKHITCSTFKVRPDSWRRFSRVFPSVAEKLRPLYFELGEWKMGCHYMPKTARLQMMRRVKVLAAKYGLRFGTCREGLEGLNTAVCDGSWMLNNAV